jgi:hypothetical protein
MGFAVRAVIRPIAIQVPYETIADVNVDANANADTNANANANANAIAG